MSRKQKIITSKLQLLQGFDIEWTRSTLVCSNSLSPEEWAHIHVIGTRTPTFLFFRSLFGYFSFAFFSHLHTKASPYYYHYYHHHHHQGHSILLFCICFFFHIGKFRAWRPLTTSRPSWRNGSPPSLILSRLESKPPTQKTTPPKSGRKKAS